MHAHNDDSGITTFVIDQNAYNRETKNLPTWGPGSHYKI
jgi:hypothetical protein